MSQPRNTAAVWFARQRAAAMSEPERQAFEDWLAEDVEHHIAYAGVERAWDVADAVRDDPRIRGRRETLASPKPARMVVGAALAAGLALAILGGGLLIAQNLMGPKPLATQAFRTDVGQRSTVTLPDGSVVTLNTDTVVRTRADDERRLVYLVKGQAFFRVAKDRRHPFVVTAAGRTVTAVGTAFDVRVDGGELKVVLVEGKVRVEGRPDPKPQKASERREMAPDAEPEKKDVQATEMLAGSVLVAPDNSAWRLARVDTVRETSWVHGQIIFDAEPLGSVIAELNRYSDQKMIIDDPALAARPLSGAFKPGDVRGFARSLESYRLAYVAAEDGQEIHFAPLKQKTEKRF